MVSPATGENMPFGESDMNGTDMSLSEKERRSLQEYIFSLEGIQEKAEELTIAHETLKRSQNLLLTVLSCTTHGICLLKKGVFIWCNSAFSDILGWSLDDLAGKPFDVVWPKVDERGKSCQPLYDPSGEIDLMTGEYDMLHKSGARVSCLVTGRPQDRKDPAGGFVISITDFTDRKRSREALEKAYADLERRAAEISLTNEDLNREIAERKAAEGSLRQYRNRLEELVRGRTALLTSMNEDLLHEIDERKNAEGELKKANDYMESILMNSPDAIVITDGRGALIRWNKMAAESFGVPFDEMKGRTFSEFFVDTAERNRVLANLLKRGCVDRCEVRLRRNDGSVVPSEIAIRLLLDNENRPIGSVAISRDLSEVRKMLATLRKTNRRLKDEITARQQVEDALRGSEALYRTIFENTGTVTIIVGEDGTILMTNGEHPELLGYPKSEIVGKMKWTDFVHEDDLEKMLEYSRLRRQGPDLVPKRYEFRLKNPKGVEKNILITTAVIPGTGKVVASLVDITEQKKMEAEAVRTQKLESLGILAGGIAHDFNNILTAIMGNASLAKLAAGPNPKLLRRLEEMEKATLRARDLTQQLLTFSRGGMPVKKTVAIAQLVSDSATFALRGSNVRVQFSFPDKLWLVEADEGQIAQVVNNLVINADQAMPEGGVIDITAENIVLDEASTPPLPPGPYVRITIRDEGVGIPDEAMERIFDPYFTTSRKGSGLGLTTAHSIVSKHGGRIAVHSKVGAGTTVEVYLPVSEKEAPRQLLNPGSMTNGKARVLVMDDEDVVRDVVGEMLKYLGYEVAFATDGAEAVEVYRRAGELGERFDACIMDLTIPGGMGGKEAVRRLIELDPHVKAIVSSGYSQDPVMAEHRQYGFVDVVTKPYKIQDLAEVLSRVLPGAQPPGGMNHDRRQGSPSEVPKDERHDYVAARAGKRDNSAEACCTQWKRHIRKER